MANYTMFLTCVVYVYFVRDVRSLVLSLVNNNTVCYKDVGCFSSGGAFRDNGRIISTTPASPKTIGTNFILYTKEGDRDGQELDARELSQVTGRWTNYKNRPTKFIVHGWLDNYKLVSWMEKMKDAFLKHGDYNVIIVDWSGGNLPPYTQSTANTRVVGAQIALLIQKLKIVFDVTPSQFHITGHSLGAHVAGYAGERVPGIGRITGLDPAGPFFSGTDRIVRLDPSDADFVDVIHSDASSLLTFGLGIFQTLGHVDFYPNLGHDQPGCEPDVIKSVVNLLDLGLADDFHEVFGCNHVRAIKFFTESLTTTCPFMAFPCNSPEHFTANRCHSCPKGGCASMGINADQHKPPPGTTLKYYTTTADSAPFCQYHMFIKIKLAATPYTQRERGTIEIRFHGDKGTSNWIQLDQEAHYHDPGTTYERAVGYSSLYGFLITAEIKFHHEGAWTDVSSWNIFRDDPKLYLKELHVSKEEQGKEIHLCAGNKVMENHESVWVAKRCKT